MICLKRLYRLWFFLQEFFKNCISLFHPTRFSNVKTNIYITIKSNIRRWIMFECRYQQRWILVWHHQSSVNRWRFHRHHYWIRNAEHSGNCKYAITTASVYFIHCSVIIPNSHGFSLFRPHKRKHGQAVHRCRRRSNDKYAAHFHHRRICKFRRGTNSRRDYTFVRVDLYNRYATVTLPTTHHRQQQSRSRIQSDRLRVRSATSTTYGLRFDILSGILVLLKINRFFFFLNRYMFPSHFQEISARDIDLRNNQVTFSSTDSGVIVVGTSDRPGVDGKTFYATLKTDQQLLNINGRMEFIITGTVRILFFILYSLHISVVLAISVVFYTYSVSTLI